MFAVYKKGDYDIGQKVNPHGLRIGVIKDWDSKWYEDDEFADFLVEDYVCSKWLRTKDWDLHFEKISVKARNFAIRRWRDCRRMKKCILFALNHIWHRTKRQIVVVV